MGHFGYGLYCDLQIPDGRWTCRVALGVDASASLRGLRYVCLVLVSALCAFVRVRMCAGVRASVYCRVLCQGACLDVCRLLAVLALCTRACR